MSNKEQVDRDLRDYLAKADNLRNADKMSYLRALFDKHFTFNKLDHSVNKGDLFEIISVAKGNYSKQGSRIQISGKEVEVCDLTTVAVIESFIGYLNKHDLLKKKVAFDYSDASETYEGISDL